MFEWPQNVVERTLCLLRKKKLGEARQDTVQVVMTSSYSGMGCAEIAAGYVQQAMLQQKLGVNVTLHSQTEKEEACYPFLSAPHVFEDLKERVDKRLWTKLCRLQQKFIRKAEAAAEKSASSKGQGRGRGKRCDKATNLQELGDKFLHAAAKLLDDNMNYFKKSGACLKCGQTCCWTFRQGDSETAAAPEAIWVEAAGNTCTPWSSRSSRKGWLDEESLVALVWAWSLKAGGQSPDAVINENTPAWPAEKLWHLVWPSCVVMSETFSPCDMGVPCNRVRRYTVVLPQQGRLKTMAPLDLETLSAMAFRQLRCTGSVFACAPQPLVKQRMDELAAAKALQPRPPGKCRDCKSVLASGDRVRLDAHSLGSDGWFPRRQRRYHSERGSHSSA